MKGVTIIAEYVVKNGGGGGWLLVSFLAGFVVFMLSVILVCFIKGCRDSYFDTSDWITISIISLVILLFGFLCVGAAKNFADDSTHMEYSVTLDESVSYLEFTEKYEVLEEEDGVYRVREK